MTADIKPSKPWKRTYQSKIAVSYNIKLETVRRVEKRHKELGASRQGYIDYLVAKDWEQSHGSEEA